MSALIPQECTTKIHSTVKTTADRVQDKLRLFPTALWLLLLPFLFVPICYRTAEDTKCRNSKDLNLNNSVVCLQPTSL